MKTVLIIDEDQTFLDKLEGRLSAQHYRVLRATDGVEGLVVAMSEKPDLIILDVLIPQMDGYALARELKWKDGLKDVPVLMLAPQVPDTEASENDGPRRVLVKPLDPGELLGQVDECLNPSFDGEKGSRK